LKQEIISPETENGIIQQLKNIYPIGDDALGDFMTSLSQKKFLKHTIIQKAGKVAKELYFIESGVVRHFYTNEDKEVTTWFSQEGEFVANSSFFMQQQGYENIESLEDLSVFAISYVDFERLCQEYSDISHLVRVFMTSNFFMLDQHYASTHLFSAIERYENLLQNFPDFIIRIPLIYIASFLGISPETLSRIRRKV